MFKIILFTLAILFDSSTNKLETQFHPRIEFPGFKTDTIQTTHSQVCILPKTGNTKCEERFPIDNQFIIRQDSTIVEKMNGNVTTTFKIVSYSQDSVPTGQGLKRCLIRYSRYFMMSESKSDKTGYILEKLNDVDFIKLYCIRDTDIYRICFFNELPTKGF